MIGWAQFLSNMSTRIANRWSWVWELEGEGKGGWRREERCCECYSWWWIHVCLENHFMFFIQLYTNSLFWDWFYFLSCYYYWAHVYYLPLELSSIDSARWEGYIVFLFQTTNSSNMFVYDGRKMLNTMTNYHEKILTLNDVAFQDSLSLFVSLFLMEMFYGIDIFDGEACSVSSLLKAHGNVVNTFYLFKQKTNKNGMIKRHATSSLEYVMLH